MSSPQPPSPAGADDADPTVKVPSPSDLLRANVGHILGSMLDEGIAGTEREGDSIGPYRLCEIIGEGGFGNVWRAEQTEVVKREVAVKVIKLGMDTAQVIGRFDQERQALASLDHPNIATMLDAGVGPNGRPYFAMELVRGGTITKWCQTHAAALPERLRLFIQVCLAVHHAHEKGILHRDLKPTNILIAEVDGAPVPKVIDFGIAKAMHASTLDDLSQLTQMDQVIGTPVYMSPEQIEGGRRLDPRSDVYALGVLLYELLTGVLPFDTTTTGGIDAIKHLILEFVPERPSTRVRQKTTAARKAKRGFQTRLSTLPADLDWITMKALEKDRLRRYQTAAEFAADVQRHLDNMPVVARPPSLTYKAGRWLRRHRRGVITAGIGAVVSAIVVTTAVTYYQAEQAKRPRPIVLDSKGVFTNDLGMKFVDVPGTDVLMCIHETRHKDFQAYANEVPGAIAIWSNGVERGLDPPVENRGDHPVIRVNWEESAAFCAWLSRKEKRAYRLPTDREWSYAVGIGGEEKWTKETTPSTIFRNNAGFPWGLEWPPPAGTGNYSDEARVRKAPTTDTYFTGYDDGYFTTAPVMSYKPNKLGIYDLSGNLNEWVEDWWDATRQTHSLRGGAWTDAKKDNLLSSWRINGGKAPAHPAFGFRCVLERRPTFHADPTPVIVKPPEPKFPKTMTPEQAAKASLTNSLGMKFVPIPGTDVLFCIHETRRRDYVAFDKEVPQTGAGLQWKNQRWGDEPTGMADDHPVSGVNWEEALSFCAWLAKKEERAYRLPTDAEWSIAVGIGELERLTSDSTPAMLSGIAPGAFPYGTGYPPLPGQKAGNYADLAHSRSFPTADVLKNYDDGFVTSAPVMHFPANPLGLYDMGGNVNEWTSSWISAMQSHRVLRGGSWEDFNIDGLRSGKRFAALPGTHRASYGFRCVIESDLPTPGSAAARFPAPLPKAEVTARSITNSLGMKFIPVPGADVLFCIHETRRQDYAEYARHFEVNNSWQLQQRDGFPAGAEDDHPVLAISWEDAQSFCTWLSRKEDRLYRLPTDREWSIAVGFGPSEAKDATPEKLSAAAQKEFPFGTLFPPRGKAGNYADESFRRAVAKTLWILGYDDGFATTAPVMSFKANPFGLYDLGGNAVEWCEDRINPKDKKRVQRGAGWANSALPDLASTKRFSEETGIRNFSQGFRCVLVPGGKPPPLTGKQTLKPLEPVPPVKPPHPHAISALQARKPPAFPESLTLAAAEKQAVTNSLGMKLLPVPGTSVLFCVHETRHKDYATYAESAPKVEASWKNQTLDGVRIEERKEEHPVHSVNWQDAQDFCAWLSQKEGRPYRLPTDREWSYAAGIGAQETWKQNTTPQTVFKVQNHFPWEGVWPPPARSGNFFDEARRAKVPRPNTIYLDDYEDGFATTAPVMSYQPNSRGLYDMAGNVWEWCEDAFDHDHRDFPLRGGAWSIPGVAWSNSSFRYPRVYTSRSPTQGFRIVLDTENAASKDGAP